VDLLEGAGYDGARHFDFKPARTEDEAGVWAAAAPAGATTGVRRASQGVPGGPGVAAALTAPGWPSWPNRTLAPGESLTALRSEDSTSRRRRSGARVSNCWTSFALEHLFGIR